LNGAERLKVIGDELGPIIADDLWLDSRMFLQYPLYDQLDIDLLHPGVYLPMRHIAAVSFSGFLTW
jgi:hypothetical protein